jgi:capsular exopolysaccharide synthesis family protein
MVDLRTDSEAGDREELNLAELWNTLLRNRWLVLGITVAVAGLAALYTLRTAPVYQSGVTLAVDDDKSNRNPLSELTPYGGGGQGKLETDIVVLRSRRVAEAVVDSLDLTVQVAEPNLPRDQVLRTIHVPRDAPAGVYVLERGDGAAYSLHAERAPSGLRLPARVEPGVPFKIGGAELALAPGLARDGAPGRVVFTISRFRNAVAGMQAMLGVARLDPKAKVLAVSYTTTDPVQAAAVPNVLSERFIEYKAALTKQESRNTVEFLRGQVASYQGEVSRAENALRGFREQQRVVSPQEEAVQQVQRLATLQAQRDALRSEREALAKLLDRVSQGRTDGRTSQYRQLASFPVFLANNAVQNFLQALTALENERASLLVSKTERNADVQGLDTRIREIELQLYQIARDYLEGLDTQLASTEANLGRFGTQLEAIPAREVEFARLSRQQKVLDDIYSLLQTRLKEAEIREAAEPNDVRVIDSALVPERPISPRPFRNLVLGLVAGLVAGVAAAFARETLDTRVRTREDVQAATGSMPILGVIPRFDTARAPSGTRRFNTSDLGLSESLVVRTDPQSPAAEAFRSLRTSIVFSGVRGAPQVMVVTSAMPGEGKSTSSSNLALTLAQQGSRTLLVDADLRRGTVHRIFDVPQEPGLTHVLLGMVPLEAAVHVVEVSENVTLSVLPAGAFPPNPAEILGSERMTRLLEELRGKYDAVIFDAPPLNLVTDATVLAKMVDAAVLVTRNGFTDKRALQHAASQLLQVRAPVSGVVLNDVDVTGGGRYYGYGYGYGYGYYTADAVGANGKNGKHGKNGKAY